VRTVTFESVETFTPAEFAEWIARARQMVEYRLRGERYDAGHLLDAEAILTSQVLLDLRLPVADLLPRP
jgi:hypothetical protein